MSNVSDNSHRPARIPPPRLGRKVLPDGLNHGPAIPQLSTAVFACVALGFLAAAVWAATWGIQAHHPLGVALCLMLTGLSVAMAYEAAVVWRQHRMVQQRLTRDVQPPQTISQLANAAFKSHQILWVCTYLVIMLVVGALTMHFTRLVDSRPDWALLATAALLLVNGALISYWLDWLP
jgi:hypothetical protein